MPEPILIVDHLSRSFGVVHAVKDVSLRVTPGQIYGLVGPDGAGKTTTLRLICGAFKSDEGTVNIGGFPLETRAEQARELVGYLSQQFSLYEDLTVLENIRFLAEVRGMSRDEWLPRSRENLAFVGLDAFETRLAGQLSGGMKQKLGLACALVNRPRLLLLDEPTTGVDPVTRQDFWQLVIRLAGEHGMAVLVCTPYMDEAERCRRVAFMSQGRIIASGSPDELRERTGGGILVFDTDNPRHARDVLAKRDDVLESILFGDALHVLTAKPSESEPALTDTLASAGIFVKSVLPSEPGLEDVFVHLASNAINGGRT